MRSDAARRAPAYLASSESSESSEVSEDSQRVLLVDCPLKMRKVTFQVTLHKNGSLCGWWVRIWIGAGGEPSCAKECLDLSQNIILLSTREQFLTADSLVLWKLEKVLPDMLSYLWTFFCCPDEI